MYVVKRSDSEIDDVLGWCVDNPGKYAGMTYQDGVEAALLWVTGQTDENPAQ